MKNWLRLLSLFLAVASAGVTHLYQDRQIKQEIKKIKENEEDAEEDETEEDES